ncbi:restriction endonuclease [Sulfurimonas sp.]|uniref:restriction endonuclease n=1 Tax=Sulfurimonas sp. TaxID=2022749 RepID=UPI002AAF335F|nr:restriction endonuclease [Sulfurimonas sp.]
MFYESQDINKKNEYRDSLKIIGSLSNLFSDSNVPYLYYRIAEKIFCNSFSANDLSRGDVALDAIKNNIGIGLKTFLAGNNKSFQKVAEFNKDKPLYENKSPAKLIQAVAELRNERIKFTENLYGIDKSIYHCVIRDENSFKLYEENMNYVDIDNITDVKKVKNSIRFNDAIHDYSFNISKSTLTKRFNTSSLLDEFNVEILKNPLEDIRNCILQNELLYSSDNNIKDTVYLPLYGKNKTVYEKSGLNQWNANGRLRNENEVYLPIPVNVHKKSPAFFPDRDSPFNLKLPKGDVLQVKVCQDNSKALMSYSNRELGQWILRDVLSLEEGELVTYEKLQILGVDSVRIDKIDNINFEINFASLGSFENYLESN